ncbi:hypothetical protein [Thiomonas sp. FB-Cd]|uniref:hypothetical protein n=1 Tax=Thiomonas sp. FB-Cd TaxID=1158292 RepID=UPI0004DF29B1|nr:hypothetical protein [Thiomonas sp. FB-Cd]
MFSADAPASTELDMAITRADFARQLTMAFGPLQAPRADTYVGQSDCCAWSITLRPATPTRLGRIVLERWTVSIELTASTPEGRAQWWNRFGAYFQKGGG